MKNAPPSEGLFYSACDSEGKFRMGWIANAEHNDFDSLDAWIEALQNIKADTPDFHLFAVKRLPFGKFTEIVQQVA